MIKKSISIMLIVIMTISLSACDKVKKDDWYNKNVDEIKSLSSTDYSDLDYLKDILKDKKIVCLGENFHSVGDYRIIKTRLIKYLHEELGFDAIGFESGLGEAAMVMNNDDLSAKDMMKYSILPVWHSSETIELFEYIKEQKETDNPLDLFGFDMQFTSLSFIGYIAQWIKKIDEQAGEDYYNLEIEFFQSYFTLVNKYGLETGHEEEYQEIIDKYSLKYEEITKYIQDNRDSLESIYPDNDLLVDSAIRTLENRMNNIKMMMVDNVAGYELRDAIMADNVKWYIEANPDKKIILWGHNDHIAKNTSKMLTLEDDKWINSFLSMGELLNREYKEDMYVIGLYMQGGKASAITTQQVFDIPTITEGSLEEIISRSGFDNAFIDLSIHEDQNDSNKWMFSEIYANEDGLSDEVIRSNVQKLIPKEQYDGIILLNEVYPPSTYNIF